jgi:hypothetical protein
MPEPELAPVVSLNFKYPLSAYGHKRKFIYVQKQKPRLSGAFRYSRPLNYGDVFVDLPCDSRSVLRSASYC